MFTRSGSASEKERSESGGEADALLARDGGGLAYQGMSEEPQDPTVSTGPKYLSLDFDRIINAYSVAATRTRNTRKKASNTDEDETEEKTKDHGFSLHKEGRSRRHRRKDEKQVMSSSGGTVTRWVLTCMVGLCTGLTAVFILFSVECLVSFRVNRLNRQLQWVTGYASDEEIRYWYHEVRFFDLAARHFGLSGVYAGYVAYNFILVLSSAALVILFAPEAVGSGIPEVKAFLNGIRVGAFASTRLFFLKVLGTILAVGSGLVVGPEGPVVHLGAIIGASLTKTGDMEAKLRQFRRKNPTASKIFGCADRIQLDAAQTTPQEDRDKRRSWFRDNDVISSCVFYLSHFRNDLERRHLISIGAAAGFASAFGAPVGGLLYSMEEASSFFGHDMLWKTLTATAIATMIIAVYHGDLTKYSMLSLEVARREDSSLSRFSEFPLYVVVGTLGGLLGSTYNNIFKFMNEKRKHYYGSIAKQKWRYVSMKILEVGLVSILTSVLMLSIPIFASWACQDIDTAGQEHDPGFMHRYNCAPGQINEIGSILFGSREESIKDILTNPEDFKPGTLLTVGTLFLLLMTITFGVALPTGNFMPTVLAGASLGGYFGLVFKNNFVSSVHPSDFAIVGAAALLAGMQRNTVSLCVILMEGTGQTKSLIPVIITVVCARTVGDLFSEGIYEIGLELKEYPYLMHEAKNHYDMFTASDVMSKSFDTVKTTETAAFIENLLLSSTHHAFPVVNEKTGQYVGLVRRDQLVALIECKIFTEKVKGDGSSSSFSLEQESFTGSDEEQIEEILGQDNQRYRFTRMETNVDEEWDPNKPDIISPWLRDNILTSANGSEIMFGMDETLPNGLLQKDSKTVVKIVDNKMVVFVAPQLREKHVDVGSIMNVAAFTVMDSCPLSRVYDLFVSMGLRHLPVLCQVGEPVGMIDRYNLSDEYVEEATGYILH